MTIPRLTSTQSWVVYSAAAFLCGAVTIGAWLVVIGPALAQHQARQDRLGELAAHRQKAGSVASALSRTRRQEAAVTLDLAASNLRLSPAGSVNEKLAGITKLANDCKLTVEEVRPGSTFDTPFYQIVELKLAGSGSFPAFTRFLHRLHEEHRDIGLRALETAADNASPLTPLASFRLTLNWYAAGPALPAPSVAKTE